MELRGAAPASVCPRCGAQQPPTHEPLAHCATCKLAYDPRSEPVVRGRRRRDDDVALVRAPRGIRIAREPGAVVIRWAPRRGMGVAAMLFGVLCAVVWLGNRDTPGEDAREMALLFGAAIGLLFAGANVAFREVVLRVDENQLAVRREPLRLGRSVQLDRREIERIVLVPPARGESALCRVCAVTRRGPIVIGAFPAAQREQASCVKDVVEEALGLIEPA